MECMPSENELTAALMRLCDGPDDHARLHMQARANHGHVVTLDCDYDAEGLTATFIEQAADAPKSQRILTAMRADTPSASAARRIAYAYQDLIGTVGNPPAVTVDLLEQRIARIAPLCCLNPSSESHRRCVWPRARKTHARSNCTAQMHTRRRTRPCCGSMARQPTGFHAPRCGVSKTGMRPTPWSTTPLDRSTTSSWTCCAHCASTRCAVGRDTMAHCAGRTTGRAERTICYALMSACMHTTGVD